MFGVERLRGAPTRRGSDLGSDAGATVGYLRGCLLWHQQNNSVSEGLQWVCFFVPRSHHIAAFDLFIMGANVRPGYGGELWMRLFIWLQMRVCVLKQEALIYNT